MLNFTSFREYLRNPISLYAEANDEMKQFFVEIWGGDFKYTLPTDKSQMLFDFYMLDFIEVGVHERGKRLVDVKPPPQFRTDIDFPKYAAAGSYPATMTEKVNYMIEETRNVLYPGVRKAMLDAVFFSICAEARHTMRRWNMQKIKDELKGKKFRISKDHMGRPLLLNQDNKMIDYEVTKNAGVFTVKKKADKEGKGWREIKTDMSKLMVEYMKNYTLLTKVSGGDALVRDPRLGSRRSRNPNIKGTNSEYAASYKAALTAIKKVGADKKDFVALAEWMFTHFDWGGGYGGPNWGNICMAWRRLYNNKFTKGSKAGELKVAIDNVWDLQHNTNTVFNKVKSYSINSSYSWLAQALDKKRDAPTPFGYLEDVSPQMRRIAGYAMYEKHGITLQMLEDQIKEKAEQDKKQKEQEAAEKAIEKATKQAPSIPKKWPPLHTPKYPTKPKKPTPEWMKKPEQRAMQTILTKLNMTEAGLVAAFFKKGFGDGEPYHIRLIAARVAVIASMEINNYHETILKFLEKSSPDQYTKQYYQSLLPLHYMKSDYLTQHDLYKKLKYYFGNIMTQGALAKIQPKAIKDIDHTKMIAGLDKDDLVSIKDALSQNALHLVTDALSTAFPSPKWSQYATLYFWTKSKHGDLLTGSKMFPNHVAESISKDYIDGDKDGPMEVRIARAIASRYTNMKAYSLEELYEELAGVITQANEPGMKSKVLQLAEKEVELHHFLIKHINTAGLTYSELSKGYENISLDSKNKVDALVNVHPPYTNISPSLRGQILHLIRQPNKVPPNKIPAIKLLREKTGYSLLIAKLFVEWYQVSIFLKKWGML